MTARVQLARWLRAAAFTAARSRAVLHRVLGVPDYDAYVAHQAAHHPGEAVLSRGEFIERRLAQRYEKAGAKCC